MMKENQNSIILKNIKNAQKVRNQLNNKKKNWYVLKAFVLVNITKKLIFFAQDLFFHFINLDKKNI